MPSTLVFADGVRLALKEELPGPSARQDELWARIQSASIHSGFTLRATQDAAFRYYAEANIHAHDIWSTFRDLCGALLLKQGALLLSFKDDDPAWITEAPVADILSALESHKDQLTHDGYVQFGIVCQNDDGVSEVLVAPTKFFKVWFNDDRAFTAQMAAHDIPRAQSLQFLDQYPHVTTRLADGRALIVDELEAAILARLSGVQH